MNSRGDLLVERNRGELVARIILIRAQDLAIKSIRSDKNIDEKTRLHDLWTFFSTLFPEHASKLAAAKPGNKKDGMTMEDACKYKYVRVNPVTFILVQVKNTTRVQTVHLSAELLLKIFDDVPTSVSAPTDILYSVSVRSWVYP